LAYEDSLPGNFPSDRIQESSAEMADDCFDIWQPSLGVFSAPRVTETRAQEIELEQDIQASIFGIRRRLTQPNPVAKLSV
jgi:hypothetical protein